MVTSTASKRKTAAILVIGNEILSGRTHDKNIPYIAQGLVEHGIELHAVRVTPDVEARVVEDLNALRSSYDYVFTTGGIGPTHDDITTECVAKAFGVASAEHPDVIEGMKLFYADSGQELNKERRKMAIVPDGAELILNPVSIAPGYRMDNVFVMAGIPKIMQAMFDSVLPLLTSGQKILSTTVHAACGEGDLAAELTAIQDQFPEVEIGSYPVYNEAKQGPATNLVARCDDPSLLSKVEQALQSLVQEKVH